MSLPCQTSGSKRSVNAIGIGTEVKVVTLAHTRQYHELYVMLINTYLFPFKIESINNQNHVYFDV